MNAQKLIKTAILGVLATATVLGTATPTNARSIPCKVVTNARTLKMRYELPDNASINATRCIMWLNKRYTVTDGTTFPAVIVWLFDSTNSRVGQIVTTHEMDSDGITRSYTQVGQ